MTMASPSSQPTDARAQASLQATNGRVWANLGRPGRGFSIRKLASSRQRKGEFVVRTSPNLARSVLHGEESHFARISFPGRMVGIFLDS